MADPRPSAIRKVVERAVAAIALVSPELQGFIDRTPGEPLSEGEWPGYLLRYEVRFSLSPELGQYQNEALLTFECQSGNASGATLDQTNQRSVTSINDALQADPTLGGMVEDIQPVGSDNSQPESPDVGAAILQARVTFYTLIHDHSTIVGVGGQLFP